MQKWICILVSLVMLLTPFGSLAESFDAPFLDMIASALPLRDPLPEHAGGAVALYQSLFAVSALCPEDHVDSLLQRLSLCNVYPTSTHIEGESTVIAFSDLYSIVIQGDPIQNAWLRFQCGETQLQISIRADYTVATIVANTEEPELQPLDHTVTAIDSHQSYHVLEASYESKHPISDAKLSEYNDMISACIEFMQIAKLSAFLYPDMAWDEFEILLEEMGIADQGMYSENIWTLQLEPLNTGDIIYETCWEDGFLRSASIRMNPSIVTTTPPTVNIFEEAEFGEMVLIYCPCVYIDLCHTWRCNNGG